jgi:aspartyl-tRNA synthetase
MFEWDGESKRWNAAHHPFTSLHDEDMAKLETSYDSIHDPKSPLGKFALAYDVVLNGTELGSARSVFTARISRARFFAPRA